MFELVGKDSDFLELPAWVSRFARVKNPVCPCNFFIFRLRMHVLRLKMCILSLKMHILRLEMKKLAAWNGFPARESRSSRPPVPGLFCSLAGVNCNLFAPESLFFVLFDVHLQRKTYTEDYGELHCVGTEVPSAYL